MGSTALARAHASRAARHITRIAGLALAWSVAARAQSSTRLALGDVLGAVAARNPRAAAARALGEAARERVPGAKRPPDPTAQLGWMNYSLPHWGPMPVLGMTQLQLMQMVPLGGKLRLAGTAAESRAASAEWRAADVAWDARTQAAMGFYDIYAADRGLESMRETLRLLDDIANTAEAMYRVGQGRQADVLRAQVEIVRMAEDTVRMRAMRTGMTARLSALADGVVFGGTPALPAFPTALPAVAWVDSVAFLDRPMLRATVEGVREAGVNATLAARELWPDVQLGVQLATRSGEMGQERMASLMVGTSVPVFARDRQLRMRSEAAAMARMADADLAAMRAEARARVVEALASLDRARTLQRIYRSTLLPQAEAAVASALAAYRTGGVDFMTVLDDRMAVNRLRQELAVLEADEGKAWAELEMLAGRALVDLGAAAGGLNGRNE